MAARKKSHRKTTAHRRARRKLSGWDRAVKKSKAKRIPLRVLEKRAARLARLVKSRGGHVAV